MAEYIEREAALSAQNKSMNLSECRKRLESIPAADVRKIKRGQWSFDNIIFTDADGVSRSGMWGYKCSECDGFCIGESNFCPNCGADMREES